MERFEYDGILKSYVLMLRLVFEFPASGGIIPSSSFRTAKLYQYFVTDSIITLVGMLLLVGFLVYFTIEERYEIAYFRWNYITVFWNVIDFFIVFVSEGKNLKNGNLIGGWKNG